MTDVVLWVDDWRSVDSVCVCRICHEEELESCKKLEAPCACSGTAKFAHRDCVQRWCNEKGNTTCEICLQRFEPGYVSALPKKTGRIDATVTIRGSLEVLRNDQEGNPREVVETEHSECASATDRSGACCRSVALMLTALLLIKQLFDVVVGGAGDYHFSLMTVVIAKTSGILLPMYIVVRIVTAIQDSIRHDYESSEGSDYEDGRHL
ncbi:uncharacterized protein LOC127258847 [Andrographis paniculata]|uniref:uncharacterized protein LOC127258847 n=1 Tax=Andrographis paniculata TaxID=175694 RepID=UPI0021E8D32F|nr:uncharacterized protein LOC127258847 [Andrographis paniculata]